MILNVIYGILILIILIRTIAFGIYCIKESGITGGISVFILALGEAITGYMILFAGKGLA
ncbi:MAG: hypothetical protein PUD92_03775 [Clostridiales bacterium]|nr:hypothetical protein [Clostridiales bacterium]